MMNVFSLCTSIDFIILHLIFYIIKKQMFKFLTPNIETFLNTKLFYTIPCFPLSVVEDAGLGNLKYSFSIGLQSWTAALLIAFSVFPKIKKKKNNIIIHG